MNIKIINMRKLYKQLDKKIQKINIIFLLNINTILKKTSYIRLIYD